MRHRTIGKELDTWKIAEANCGITLAEKTSSPSMLLAATGNESPLSIEYLDSIMWRGYQLIKTF